MKADYLDVLQLVKRSWKPDIIAAQAANPIFGKLQFYVIISSAIDPKSKKSPIRNAGRSLRLLITAETW